MPGRALALLLPARQTQSKVIFGQLGQVVCSKDVRQIPPPFTDFWRVLLRLAILIVFSWSFLGLETFFIRNSI